MTLTELKNSADDFLKVIFQKMDQAGISLENHWSVDHLCYRTSSLEMYQSLKRDFLGFSELLIESEVNGRQIATFKLPAPLRYEGHQISVVELPAPKTGKTFIDGFEHLEIVCDVDFAEIKSRYPDCHFDESGLKKNFNAELEIKLGQHAIKFHHMSLEAVIEVEKRNIPL